MTRQSKMSNFNYQNLTLSSFLVLLTYNRQMKLYISKVHNVMI